jgi:MoaA/NifB/PqqE/SkfB family radical SAM enzyme
VQVGFDLNWNFFWMKPNFWELEPVIALASKIGIKGVRILRLMLNGRARENRDMLELPVELESQCEPILNFLTSRYPGVFIAHSKPLAFQLGRSNRDHVASCSAGKGQLIVQADGRVLPCIGMKDTPQLEIGNVRTETIEDIFSHARGMNFPEMSQEYRECPAILFQKAPELIQLTPGRN